MKRKPTYLTISGVERLRTELNELTTVRRPELARRLRTAIQMGDLSENADYITTKEEQAFLEGKILEIEEMLRSAVIISEHLDRQDISIGATFTIVENNASPEKYTLVGPAEADPANGRISHESPIGQALLGKSVGETVIVNTPSGQMSLKIVSIT